MKTDVYNFVKGILERYPATRDDDMKLYAIACATQENPVPNGVTFYNALYKHEDYNMPSYESITRARRKVQEQEETLRGRKYKARHDREREYRDQYSPSNGGEI